MCTIRAKEIARSQVLRLETEINNLWGEVKTLNIPPFMRQEFEEKLKLCEQEFKSAMAGKGSVDNLQKKLESLDYELAKAAINQAIQEMPKGDLAEISRLALDDVKRKFEEKSMTPVRARHEVKEIIRHLHM